MRPPASAKGSHEWWVSTSFLRLIAKRWARGKGPQGGLAWLLFLLLPLPPRGASAGRGPLCLPTWGPKAAERPAVPTPSLSPGRKDALSASPRPSLLGVLRTPIRVYQVRLPRDTGDGSGAALWPLGLHSLQILWPLGPWPLTPCPLASQPPGHSRCA